MEERGIGQYFERNRATLRLVLGFVDVPHATAADFAEDPKIAQRRRPALSRRVGS